MTARKGLNANDKRELWEQYKGRCRRCGLPIDRDKGELHWGHITAKSLGGSNTKENRAPEHARCNLDSAYRTEIPVAAKVKRVAEREFGERKQSDWSRKLEGMKETYKYNWKTRRYERID